MHVCWSEQYLMIPGIHCGSCETLSTICTNGEAFVSGDTYWCLVRGEEETLRLLESQGVGPGAYDTPVSQLIRTAPPMAASLTHRWGGLLLRLGHREPLCNSAAGRILEKVKSLLAQGLPLVSI